MATESSRSVVCHKKCLMYVEFSLSFLSLLSQQKCTHCRLVATKIYKTKTSCLIRLCPILVKYDIEFFYCNAKLQPILYRYLVIPSYDVNILIPMRWNSVFFLYKNK